MLALAGNEVYIIHYSGLGMSKGSFTFTKSIIDTYDLVNLINDKITIVGHSWGGFVALNVLRQFKNVEKLILLSPFTNLPDNNFVKEFTDFVITNFNNELTHLQYEEVRDNIQELMKNYSLKDLFTSELGCKVKIFQAMNDEVVLDKDTLSFVNNFTNHKPELIFCEENHVFTKNRKLVLSNVLNSI